MPDPIDLNQPQPDLAHEGIRLAVVQAIAGISTGHSDTSDALYLVDTLFELLNDLTTRVTALEAAQPPTPAPTPAP